jgi:hypothetical protein
VVLIFFYAGSILAIGAVVFFACKLIGACIVLIFFYARSILAIGEAGFFTCNLFRVFAGAFMAHKPLFLALVAALCACNLFRVFAGAFMAHKPLFLAEGAALFAADRLRHRFANALCALLVAFNADAFLSCLTGAFFAHNASRFCCQERTPFALVAHLFSQPHAAAGFTSHQQSGSQTQTACFPQFHRRILPEKTPETPTNTK